MKDQNQTHEHRETLEPTAATSGRVKLGSLLAEVGRQARLSDEDAAAFDKVRDKTPARTFDLE